ncbi:MAG: TRAP transporter permease [Sneathiellaceae bacterium]
MTQAEADAPGQGDDLDELTSSDTGARNPGPIATKILLGVALAWSLFQVWIASPLPFLANEITGLSVVLNSTEERSLHLAFAVFLAYLAYPALKRSPRAYVPVQDWVMAAVGAFCAGYLFLFYNQLADRVGNPTAFDIWVSAVGMLLLLEATRRALGPPLTIIATIFLLYTFFGNYMPAIIAHQGESLRGVAIHQWLTTEGVFGIALGVSTKFVFLFVLFGALLDKAGAGNYFIKVAFSLLGHYRGGPAKAAVVASAMTGLISGSSIANVVTTGTFTIPMMKRVGFTREKAGAVEVASSVNGQIMPPVMGAAAFLMVEYVGISYFEVVKHAVLPALISYIALVYIVHLEAMKQDMQALPRSSPKMPFVRAAIGFLTGFLLLCLISIIVYYGLGWMPLAFGGAASWIVAVILALVYAGLLAWGARWPDLPMDDPNEPVVRLPQVRPTVNSGLHFLLPVVVLVWCLMVDRLSPGLSAFWATVFMIFILLTQRPLTAMFRRADLAGSFRQGWDELIAGLIAGARNMIGIGIATAAAGIIVGAVSQTGVGAALANVVEVLSFGNILVILLLTAVLSLILGMGLPTTANYIVVSSLLAGVVVQLGAENGLIVPLIAVHMFVFYFGIMADVTPPVGLASFAAAAVSGGDPIRTGIVAFFYSLRTAALPFLFIFNTDLLLIDVTWAEGILTFVVATLAMLVFAAATQGWFITRCRWYEVVLLLLVVFTLFRPGFWLDMVIPPDRAVPPAELAATVGSLAPGEVVRLKIDGTDAIGNPRTYYVELPVAEGASGEERLADIGLTLYDGGDGKVEIDNAEYNSVAANLGLAFGDIVADVRAPEPQPPKQLLWIPALLILAFVYMAQRRRRPAAVAAPA